MASSTWIVAPELANAVFSIPIRKKTKNKKNPQKTTSQHGMGNNRYLQFFPGLL